MHKCGRWMFIHIHKTPMYKHILLKHLQVNCATLTRTLYWTITQVEPDVKGS